MSIQTVTVQIGNSDNRLTQFAWSKYVDALRSLLAGYGVELHFFGFSAPDVQWQNCCAVFEIPTLWEKSNVEFCKALAELAFAFNQDSIALTVGDTTFIEGRSA